MSKKCQATELRCAAEARLKSGLNTELSANGAAQSNIDALRLMHELQVHQIELEMQNNELRQARAKMESALADYTELYDFAPVGYLTLTPDGLIAKLNRTAATLLGVERKEVLQARFTTFVMPEERDRWHRHFLGAKSQDGKSSIELALQREDGTLFYAQIDCVREGVRGSVPLAASPLDLAAGSGLRAVLIDITERRLAKEARLKSGALQRAIFNSVNFSSIATDARGIIQIFNVGAERMLGYTADEVLNKITPADLSDPQELIARAVALSLELSTPIAPGFEALVFKATRGIEDIYRLTYLRKDGSRLLAVVSVTALRDAQDEIIGFLLVGTDNTARMRVEAERARLTQALQEKNTELEHARIVAESANLAKSDFLSSMSHELRTPLNAILGFAQLIDAGSPAPTPLQKRSIDQILKAGWYLLELINEILELAVIEAGKLALLLEPVALAEVLLECAMMIEPQAQQRGISVAFPPPENSFLIYADRIRLKQVVINLLSNAIKYNTVGGSVSVACALSTPDVLRISVRDSGAGLAPEQIAQLFQPFNRLGQNSSVVQGTGIGLVVCKRLVELMGGTIGVDSTLGTGSVFWVELSLASDAPVAAARIAEQQATLAQAHAEDNALVRTLLYVEDNPENLMLVEDIVALRTDIRLLSAKDGESGVELARTLLPDVILMDINLPGVSGSAALKTLAQDPATAHIPVLAISANALPLDIQKGLEAGFFRYLTKPIKLHEFMATLDAALKFAQSRRSG